MKDDNVRGPRVEHNWLARMRGPCPESVGW